MSRSQTNLTERLRTLSKGDLSEARQQAATSGANDKVSVEDWEVSHPAGSTELFTECIISPKNSQDSIAYVAISVRSSDGKKLYCWGLASIEGDVAPGTGLDTAADTQIYNPQTQGLTFPGVVMGYINIQGTGSRLFVFEKSFTVTA
jgi:hypothetical protein